MTTFDELFAEHNLTPKERKALVMHLATLRAQKTVEALQDGPPASAPSTPPPAVVEAVPLNFDQLQKVMSKHFGGRELTDDEADSAEAFARAIERAHGIAPKAAQEKT